MRQGSTRVRSRLLAVVAVALLACGCSTLPTSGAVHTRPDDTGAATGEAPYFAPPGPTAGDDREGVVRGFLLAMQANPPSIAVAREFLSASARTTWKPVDGTIVYDTSSVVPDGDTVAARLSGAHRLDPRGAWDVRPAPSSSTIRFTLVPENGQWRIANPPNVLAVPASYFSSLFVPFELYFFDHTGTVLVPSRVYLSRGVQTATNLVKGLLAGPEPALADVVTSAFPPGTALENLAVVVNAAGVADVPLGRSVLSLSPAQLDRAAAQLAWTLGQVPGVNRIRITVDGATVPLADGRTEITVGADTDYDPLRPPDRTPVAIAGGRVVRIDGDEARSLDGPLGARGFSLRSLALNATGHLVAAVAASGRHVYAAADDGSRTPNRVHTVLSGADILRPAFDRFGLLWLVDRRANGAVVHVVGTRGVVRTVTVPGISGRQISAFTLTRDGTRLIAAVAGPGTPTLLVAPIVRGTAGSVARVLQARSVPVAAADPGPVVDVGQAGATTVALLTQPTRGPGRVTVAELDGSPGDPGTTAPTLVPTQVLSLAVGPVSQLGPLVVAADHRLLRLSSSGRWEEVDVGAVQAVAYPQ